MCGGFQALLEMAAIRCVLFMYQWSCEAQHDVNVQGGKSEIGDSKMNINISMCRCDVIKRQYEET